MAQVCNRCRRPNPNEAVYCYNDGVPLEGRAADVPGGIPRDIGAQPFAMPFVLPTGRSCDTFNQLALACRQDSETALGMLRTGQLEAFLTALARPDLARAARTAATAADRERGLDEFLGRLPGTTLTPAHLRVQPMVLELGTMRPGEDRRCELVLDNDGLRLLYGSASCDDVPWLSLADGATQRRKVFQFTDGAVLPVHVLGRHLRAYNKPQEAEVRLESSGGTLTVRVRVFVPVRPFPEGVLAGSMSPRQLAEKAREALKAAVPLIESGAVARWYASNGWAYPVSGPTASGTAAVQQLFEALGLARPPRVELGEETVRLHGNPGQKVEYVLAVVSQENRAVVAHGSSDQDWLRVGPTVFRGRTACLPLTAVAPARPGETLHAQVAITANGGQRLVAPVTLVVGGRPHPAPPPHLAATLPPSYELAATLPPPAQLAATLPPPRMTGPGRRFAREAPPALVPPPPAAPARPPLPAPLPDTRSGRRLWLTLLPAGLLVAALLGVVLRDVLAPAAAPTGPPPLEDVVDDVPRIDLRFHDLKRKDELEQLLLTAPEPTMRFGLVELYRGKEVGRGVNVRRLTFDPWGRTNNTCLRLEGIDERLFGGPRGRWEERAAKNWEEDGKRHHGIRSVWICDDLKLEVTQFVELVRGQRSNLLDTCRVRYRMVNRDDKVHRVGIRFLLDSFVGGNDGVPFTIPGESDLCDSMKDLPSQAKGKKIPDFLQALEKPDLAHPGTIAHLRLKLGQPGSKTLLETPVRVTLGAWPSEKLRILNRKAAGLATLWEVPVLSLKSLGLNDSAIVVYWQEQPLAAGAQRDVGFEYGLWNLGRQGSRLAATVDGAFRPDGQLTVVAYVNKTAEENKDETLTLELPDTFKLLAGDQSQAVPALPRGVRSGNRPVTWKVQAGPTGPYTLTVRSSSGLSQTIRVEIKATLFD